MRVALLFPGQGSQSVGMGAEWMDSHPCRGWLEVAGRVIGRDFRALCITGPKEELDKTVYTQPCIYVLSAMLLHNLKEHGVTPVVVAGHSAGEYAALLAAEVWDFETGLNVIATRARIMYECGLRRPGGMAAVIGMDGSQVNEICKETYPQGEVVVANRNTPTQTVISGDKSCIERICEILKARGARRAIPLPVSGAFHSPLLSEGVQEFTEYLKSIPIRSPVVPWISNRTGAPESSPDTIREHLAGQLNSPVQWVKTMEILEQFPCDRFLEIGPGKVLAGLVKGCGSIKPCLSVGSPTELDSILNDGDSIS